MLIGLVTGRRRENRAVPHGSVSARGTPVQFVLGKLGRSRGRELAEVPCSRRTVHFHGVRSPEAGCVGKTETGAEETPCPVLTPSKPPASEGARGRGASWPATSPSSLCLHAGVLRSPPSIHLSHFLHGPICRNFRRIHATMPLMEMTETDSADKLSDEEQRGPRTVLRGNPLNPVFPEDASRLETALL